MPIIVYKEYTATRSGAALRNETCEKCSRSFAYKVEATVEGSGSSPFFLANAKAQRDAERRAGQKLNYALQHAQQMVACPHCGWYQSGMVNALLAPRMRWMRFFAWITLLGGSFCMLLLHVMFSNQGRRPHYEERPYLIAAELGLVLIWFGSLYLRKGIVARQDPNRQWTPPTRSRG